MMSAIPVLTRQASRVNIVYRIAKDIAVSIDPGKNGNPPCK
jgi:hypothetical protein